MNKINTFILFLVMTSAGHAKVYEANAMITCGPATSPIYGKANSNDALDVYLITDYVKLNEGENIPVAGVVAIRGAQANLDYLPVFLTTRGKSRRYACAAKPFRMMFLNQGIEASIESQLGSASGVDLDPDYLKRYYLALLAMNLNKTEVEKGQDNNVFSGLGDDIKIVTHCGKSTERWLSAATLEDQHQRLLAEYYLYEMLAQLNTTVELARLMNITYFNRDGSFVNEDNDHKRLGFFREPLQHLAKRCELQSKSPGYNEEYHAGSLLQTEILNEFIANPDYDVVNGHNVNFLYDEKNHQYFGAYDFDLVPEVSGNINYRDAVVESAAGQFSEYLNKKHRNDLLPNLQSLNDKLPAMQNILKDSLLQGKYRSNIEVWLNGVSDVLINKLSEEVHE